MGLKKSLQDTGISCVQKHIWNFQILSVFYMQDGGANRYMKAFLENNRYNRKMPYRMIKFPVKLMGVYCLLFHLFFFLLWSLYLQEAGYNRVGIIVTRVRLTLVFLTLISDSTSSTFLKHRSTHVAPWNISKSTNNQVVCDKKNPRNLSPIK